MHFNQLLEKSKQHASYIFDKADKKSREVLDISKANVKIFDLKTEVESLYKTLGKQVFDSHKGIEINEEVVQKTIATISQKQQEIDKLKSEALKRKTTKICKNCSTICQKDDDFCSNCEGKV